MSRILIATLASAALLAGTAQAQGVDQRHGLQQQRVSNGIANGQLTPGETNRIERQQGRIDRTEFRMRANDGGRLTGRDRARLQYRESRASRHIYNAKHNGRVD